MSDILMFFVEYLKKIYLAPEKNTATSIGRR